MKLEREERELQELENKKRADIASRIVQQRDDKGAFDSWMDRH